MPQPAERRKRITLMLRMFSRSRTDAVPQQLYGAVVAQARNPAFYVALKFPDSVTGRFDVLALHMFLFSRRLSAEGDPRAPSLSQEVFDAFTAGLDDALRSLGIGDTSVPKRKQAMVKGFYGQIDEFAPLVAAGDGERLAGAISARFHGGGESDASGVLARYMLDASAALAAQDFENICRGVLAWPDPAGSAATAGKPSTS
jgi:cytochrome b pre-mRNA-processing protein 3